MIPSHTRTEQIIQDEHEYVVQSYVRPDFVLVHGEGVTLYDTEVPQQSPEGALAQNEGPCVSYPNGDE